MIRRKRNDIALGPSRMLGVSGIAVTGSSFNTSGGSTVTSLGLGSTGANVLPGDLILAFGMDVSGGVSYTFSASSGEAFTEILNSNGAVTACYAFASSAGVRSISMTVSTAHYVAGAIQVLRGVDTINPIDAYSPNVTGVSVATSGTTLSGITTVTNGALVYQASRATDDAAATYPIGWSSVYAQNPTIQHSYNINTLLKQTAGPTGDLSMVSAKTAPGFFSVLFAIRPMVG